MKVQTAKWMRWRLHRQPATKPRTETGSPQPCSALSIVTSSPHHNHSTYTSNPPLADWLPGQRAGRQSSCGSAGVCLVTDRTSSQVTNNKLLLSQSDLVTNQHPVGTQSLGLCLRLSLSVWQFSTPSKKVSLHGVLLPGKPTVSVKQSGSTDETLELHSLAALTISWFSRAPTEN